MLEGILVIRRVSHMAEESRSLAHILDMFYFISAKNSRFLNFWSNMTVASASLEKSVVHCTKVVSSSVTARR
jgi:hypothetical protein